MTTTAAGDASHAITETKKAVKTRDTKRRKVGNLDVIPKRIADPLKSVVRALYDSIGSLAPVGKKVTC